MAGAPDGASAVEPLAGPACRMGVVTRPPTGSTWAMVGVATAGARTPPSAGPRSSGMGTAPVATAWATTMIPPSAPTVSTAAVAAVVVQSTEADRLTRAPTGGRTKPRK